MVEEDQSSNSQTFTQENEERESYHVPETIQKSGNGKSSSLFTLLEAAESDGLTPGATTFVDIEPIELSLNPKYTFQTFVVGSCNQFAHAASQAIAEAPGKTYNPLYIYGGVGLGKTHLMHAAGHEIKARNRHLRLSYISAEKFMNELINAIRYDKAQTFREKYRSIDVMLMDDIQFMAGKERTQEEFFHTFNALYDGQKQIVISSDCPPREIPTLEERLHSRFEWGLIADMEPPDLETKVAILKRKADLDGVALPDDVAFFIASKVKSNIRELEGSLVRLVAISSLRGLPISKMLAQDAIRNIAEDDQPAGITIEQIQQVVAAHYRLRVDELNSKNNSRQIAVPRQVAMYLCKRLTKHSFPEIGREFGGKHHTTVIHSVEKIDALVLKDQNFHRVVSDLMDNLCK
jgi:chromosomal replication initiator protein